MNELRAHIGALKGLDDEALARFPNSGRSFTYQLRTPKAYAGVGSPLTTVLNSPVPSLMSVRCARICLLARPRRYILYTSSRHRSRGAIGISTPRHRGLEEMHSILSTPAAHIPCHITDSTWFP
jgi:hypothetical protein